MEAQHLAGYARELTPIQLQMAHALARAEGLHWAVIAPAEAYLLMNPHQIAKTADRLGGGPRSPQPHDWPVMGLSGPLIDNVSTCSDSRWTAPMTRELQWRVTPLGYVELVARRRESTTQPAFQVMIRLNPSPSPKRVRPRQAHIAELFQARGRVKDLERVQVLLEALRSLHPQAPNALEQLEVVMDAARAHERGEFPRPGGPAVNVPARLLELADHVQDPEVQAQLRDIAKRLKRAR